MKEVELYTDGSCLKNPGPGGYAAILRYKDIERELTQGYASTTNNRMELMAVIVGLSALKYPCKVKIVTDSKYVKDGLTSWMPNWKKNQWKTKTKQPVKNKDLWMRLDAVCQKHELQWQWVKGHDGHEENERCDELARSSAEGKNGLLLKDDSVFPEDQCSSLGADS